MKHTKQALFHSIVALILCCSMLVGTTFAWFTDEVTSGVNKIQAGNLDIELEYLDGGDWKPVKSDKSVFPEGILWEPGHTEVVYLRIVNKGNLALKYQLGIGVEGETLSVTESGEVIQLSKYIHFGAVDGVSVPFADRDAARVAVTESKALTAGYTKTGTMTATNETAYMALVVYMPESVGNEANHATGADAPSINMGIRLLATQLNSEMDSFGSDYDANADLPTMNMHVKVIQPLMPSHVENGAIASNLEMANPDGGVVATIPAGVKLSEGANTLTMSIDSMSEPKAEIAASHRSEVVHSVDVHIDGVAEDNTVPMIITINELFPSGLNNNNVKLYHVEDGQTIEMTLVNDPVNHNEFSYDPLTGNAVMAIASFSEIAVYGETAAYWNGVAADGFAGGTGTEKDPYLIANAAQLAYFRNQVDGGETYEGKFIKLSANINLQQKDSNGNAIDVSFDPIGFGYDYDGFMAGGKTFNGTFDGGAYDSNGKLVGSYTIFGLYQNGWDLDPDKTNYGTYTYSMAGGGLFASVVDATIKNLTISGADIVFECVDMGVLAGYAQGNCTFDNIAIINCTIQNYNRYTGGVVGEVSPRYDANGTALHSNHVFNNIRVDSTTTISSLWGSFDTSLGGILGGKWDKFGDCSTVTMTNCHVACTIDTFNDVTSAYQWYAYRRAGMLVGNTEQSADHKALANFLTCENVYVYYGSWNDYHYCEFTNQSNQDGSADWQNNYPWVRVEKGLSCSAYSNPRYGHPIVNDTAIVDSIHSHSGDDECMISLPFRQLYGGGQGVYGATEHDGVKEGAYTVTYINYGELLRVEFVASGAHTLWDYTKYTYGDSTPDYWVDGNGNTYKNGQNMTIAAGNKQNIILYPQWKNEYVVRCYDTFGNMVYYNIFNSKTTDAEYNEIVNEIATTLATIQQQVDANGTVIEVKWKKGEDKTLVKPIKASDLKSALNSKKDLLLTATPELKEGSISLTPIYDEAGVIVAYKVNTVTKDDKNVNVTIPPYVGTVPVTLIGDNAAAGFDNLHVLTIPTTITNIGENALASDWNNGTFGSDKGESMVIYYSGSYREWCDKVTLADGWSDGVSASTRVFFLSGTDTVDKTQGYLQFVVDDSNWLGAVKKGHFEYVNAVPDSFVSEYYKNCDCNVKGCEGNLRPDAHYWEAYVN